MSISVNFFGWSIFLTEISIHCTLLVLKVGSALFNLSTVGDMDNHHEIEREGEPSKMLIMRDLSRPVATRGLLYDSTRGGANCHADAARLTDAWLNTD